jgi:hypothetical protein
MLPILSNVCFQWLPVTWPSSQWTFSFPPCPWEPYTKKYLWVAKICFLSYWLILGSLLLIEWFSKCPVTFSLGAWKIHLWKTSLGLNFSARNSQYTKRATSDPDKYLWGYMYVSNTCPFNSDIIHMLYISVLSVQLCSVIINIVLEHWFFCFFFFCNSGVWT